MWPEIIYFLVMTLLTIALAPRPPTPKAATLSDFTLPTADQGRPVPVIFGTVNITGSNCVWYGNLSTQAIQAHTLFSSTTTGYAYRMGFHLALGHGPFDSINKVYWDKKRTNTQFWNGTSYVPLVSYLGSTPNSISRTIGTYYPVLFGGTNGGQGGIIGAFQVIFGDVTEPVNPYLQATLGEVPGFRGVTSVVFPNASTTAYYTHSDGTIHNETWPAGYIGCTPYVKAVEFECTRILQGWNTGSVWYSAKAVVTLGGPVTSPPTWAPTFSSALVTSITSTQTIFPFAYGDPNWPLDLTGYINIGTEWIYVDNIQTYTDGSGNVSIESFGSSPYTYGHANITRPKFGTTEVAYLANTPFYFYATTTIPVLAMNPAHIVYQCLTDPYWGLGLPTSVLDNTVFEAAADQFYSEGCGLCMQWVNASSVEDFLKTVLDHCAANLVMSSATGLYQLIPIRGGYNPTLLPNFNETNIAEMVQFEAQGWADQANQVILVYTDPATTKDTALTGQDLGALDVQGKLVSVTANYQGIRDHVLAANTLGRELSSRCTPLVRVKLKINRSAWVTTVGGLFTLTWADRNVTNLVMRITNIGKGKLEDNQISVDAVQDIYSLGLYNYQVSSQVTGGVPTGSSLTITQLNNMNTPSTDTGGPVVISASLTAPPASPANGDRYIVPEGATGAWSGETGMMAIWDSFTASWVFVTVPPGVMIWDETTNSYVNGGTEGGGVSVIDAVNVTYDDSQTDIGVTNVQAAIQWLVANINGAITVVGYGNGAWYGKTSDGDYFSSTDGINWTIEASDGEAAFQDLAYISGSSKFIAVSVGQVGSSNTSNVFGLWTYTTVGAGIQLDGLVYLPSLGGGTYVAWVGALVYTSTNLTTWADPVTNIPYKTVVLADAPIWYDRCGDDVVSGETQGIQDIVSGNDLMLGYDVSGNLIEAVTTPLISVGQALTSLPAGESYGGNFSAAQIMSSSAGAIVNLQAYGGNNGLIAVDSLAEGDPPTGFRMNMLGGTAGTDAFTIEMWLQSSGVPATGTSLFAQTISTTAAYVLTYHPTVQLITSTPDSLGHCTLTLQTGHWNSGTSAVVVDMTLVSSSQLILDGLPHYIVAERDGAGGAKIFLDGTQIATVSGALVSNILTLGVTDNVTSFIGGCFWGGAGIGTAFQLLGSIVMTVDELALYDSALSSTRIGIHHVSGLSGLNSEFVIDDIIWDSVNSRVLLFGGTPGLETPSVYYSSDGLVTINFLAYTTPVPATDYWTLVGVAQSGSSADIVVAFNDSSNVAHVASSTNQGATWSFPTPSWPTQSPAYGLAAIVWDGGQFVITGEGWSGAGAIGSLSFASSGLPPTAVLSNLFTNGSGTTVTDLAVVGGGIFGLATTTNGLAWTVGPVVKGTAEQITYDETQSQLPDSNVQTAINDLSSAWMIIKTQIFGS